MISFFEETHIGVNEPLEVGFSVGAGEEGLDHLILESKFGEIDFVWIEHCVEAGVDQLVLASDFDELLLA